MRLSCFIGASVAPIMRPVALCVRLGKRTITLFRLNQKRLDASPAVPFGMAGFEASSPSPSNGLVDAGMAEHGHNARYIDASSPNNGGIFDFLSFFLVGGRQDPPPSARLVKTQRVRKHGLLNKVTALISGFFATPKGFISCSTQVYI